MKKEHQALALKAACGIIILSFFLNWISMRSISVTPFNMVSGHEASKEFSSLMTIILLLLPISAGIILYYNLQKEGRYPIQRKILFSIPAAATALFFLMLNSKVSEMKQRSFGYGGSISVTDLLSYGFYLALIASALLVYLGFQKEEATQPKAD